MASSHPCLRIVALFVVGLVIAASIPTSATAFRSPQDNRGRTSLGSGAEVALTSKLDSRVQRGGRGMLLTEPGSVSPTPAAAVPVVSFEGLHFGTNGPYTNRHTPPDVQFQVGPNHDLGLDYVHGPNSTKRWCTVPSYTCDAI